ncbi:MAG: aromatic aminobenezylarsenical efflux permease ArsG family transporter [Prevotella sp.]|uniref:aromatic aminobenezylarsenical efflux permease ArsG family transporter n=1 Tax=Prevotella sp. TaxID=59823 RepID=UPI002A2BD35C|nr:aromatic aminobenezylarsenical efflux permease ArsG family transporter [Prevotella sp.]MDD7318508.1 aromatic aminobenezylarsenical efflux permease ArsG family transporter [Prevotellaceae bacterium]MDY4020313.1 aromatic aminobenezylarsenical efflux permease ArsG family transporter [Prevotella sp.]
MELIQEIMSNSQWPLLTAFVLGVLVALHPCPLATNIAAMGYIGKDVDNRTKVFVNGLRYTFGRAVGYTLPGWVIILLVKNGVEVMDIGEPVSEWGERLLAPILIIIGAYLLYNDLLHHHDHVPRLPFGGRRVTPVLLGVIFALAFCPESGIVYFGMIMPMSFESGVGYLVPASFALGTGLPVVVMSWVFAYSVGSFSRLNKGMLFAKAWLTRLVAVMFVLAGVFVLLF